MAIKDGVKQLWQKRRDYVNAGREHGRAITALSSFGNLFGVGTPPPVSVDEYRKALSEFETGKRAAADPKFKQFEVKHFAKQLEREAPRYLLLLQQDTPTIDPAANELARRLHDSYANKEAGAWDGTFSYLPLGGFTLGAEAIAEGLATAAKRYEVPVYYELDGKKVTAQPGDSVARLTVALQKAFPDRMGFDAE